MVISYKPMSGLLYQAYLFKSQGDIVHSIQVFNDLARLEQDDYRIFGELGFLLREHGDTDLAIKNWGKSLAINPDQPQIINALSDLSSSKQIEVEPMLTNISLPRHAGGHQLIHQGQHNPILHFADHYWE